MRRVDMDGWTAYLEQPTITNQTHEQRRIARGSGGPKGHVQILVNSLIISRRMNGEVPHYDEKVITDGFRNNFNAMVHAWGCVSQSGHHFEDLPSIG
jgi:hypothetical protein